MLCYKINFRTWHIDKRREHNFIELKKVSKYSTRRKNLNKEYHLHLAVTKIYSKHGMEHKPTLTLTTNIAYQTQQGPLYPPPIPKRRKRKRKKKKIIISCIFTFRSIKKPIAVSSIYCMISRSQDLSLFYLYMIHIINYHGLFILYNLHSRRLSF